jgi:hypothetical protein
MRGSFKRMGVLGNHSDKFKTKFSSMFHRERDEKSNCVRSLIFPGCWNKFHR